MTKNECSLRKLSRDILDSEDDSLGVYEILSDEQDVLYVGAGPIRSMISEHLDDGVFPMEDGTFYRKFTSGTDLERSRRTLLEDHYMICGKKPKYNS